MARRARYEANVKKNIFALNLTSMTDVFTILLVFLLQTYSNTDVVLNPVKNLRLPASNSEKNPTDAVKIAVSKDIVQFDDRTIAEIIDNKFANKDIDPKDSNFIVPLFNELDKLAKSSDKKFVKDGKILLQADADLPYNTLRKVMYTASMAGFPQLKLVTVVGK